MIPDFYQCQFCFSSFTKEETLEKHNCEYKKRYTKIKETANGKLSYSLYKKWLTLGGKSIKYIDEYTFIHSNLYKAFIKFSKFVKTAGLPDYEDYMKYMINNNVSPKFWTFDEAYKLYMDYYDFETPPHIHIEHTLQTLYQIADAMDCDISETLLSLTNKEMLLLIKARKLSPWFLLNSKTFKKYLIEYASAAERTYLHKYIIPEKWEKILSKHKDKVEKIREIIREVGL